MYDDEMPAAPASAAGTEQTVSFSGEADASAFDAVPNLGDSLPAGVYHVRLKTFKEKANDKGPFFTLGWSVQQEPHVGRMVFENYVPWANPEDFKMAAAGLPAAQAVLADRLPRVKMIMKAAEYKPTGKFDIKSFFGSNPEIKIQINVKERKEKGVDGQYHGTGEPENGVVKYISLNAPR